LYSFTLREIDGFQDNKVQTGTKKVVKIIINREIPSIPMTTELFDKTSQLILSKNWKPETVGSKKNSKNMEILKITRDQKREKFLINLMFVFSVNERTNTPISGKRVKKDSIDYCKVLSQTGGGFRAESSCTLRKAQAWLNCASKRSSRVTYFSRLL
jgi:hypothetical protein